MQLPRGITGFRHISDAPLPQCNLRAFRGHCHTAARILDGRVIETYDTDHRSYARTTLDLRDGPVAVLLNAIFPIVAVAKPMQEGDVVVELIAHPHLSKTFREFGVYEVPELSELTAHVTPETCKHLAAAELEQVKYWKPQTVAEIIFNWWD